MILSTEMLEKKASSLVLKYAIPSIVGMLSTALYIVLDGIFIGRYVGAEGLAAVHIVMPGFSFIAALGLMISIGGGTVISVEMGKRNIEKAISHFSGILTIILIISAATLSAALLAGNEIAFFLGANTSILADVLNFMQPLALFSFAFLGNFFFDYILRASGHPGKAMTVMVSASILNIFLDYITIVILELGVKGAAYSTGLAQLAGFIAMIIILKAKVKTFTFSLSLPDLLLLKRSVYNGASEFFSEMSYGFSTFLFNLALMNMVGVLGVSAFSIVGYINVLVAFVIIGLSMSIQPLISINLGAGKTERVKEILKFGYLYGLLFCGFTIISILLSGDHLVSLFTTDPELHSLALNALLTIVFGYLLMCLNIISSAFFTAIEWAGTSMIISILRGIIFILVGLYILPSFWGIQGVWLTIPFAELATLFPAAWFLFRFITNSSNNANGS